MEGSLYPRELNGLQRDELFGGRARTSKVISVPDRVWAEFRGVPGNL